MSPLNVVFRSEPTNRRTIASVASLYFIPTAITTPRTPVSSRLSVLAPAGGSQPSSLVGGGGDGAIVVVAVFVVVGMGVGVGAGAGAGAGVCVLVSIIVSKSALVVVVVVVVEVVRESSAKTVEDGAADWNFCRGGISPRRRK